VNRARASWLISRAHAVLGHGELALHHADRSAAHLTQAVHEADDFDHAYAFEARARALACLGRLDEAREAYRRAVAVDIADEQDRAIVRGDLDAEPWFGLERA
jgi:predicted RNA polymerase sigma factor